MQVRVTELESGVHVLAPHGQLDIDTGPALRAALDRALDRPEPRIVVDLGGLDFCDSTGLSALLLAHGRAGQEGGWLRLARPSPFLSRVLRTVGLADRLEMYAAVNDALSGVRRTWVSAGGDGEAR